MPAALPPPPSPRRSALGSGGDDDTRIGALKMQKSVMRLLAALDTADTFSSRLELAKVGLPACLCVRVCWPVCFDRIITADISCCGCMQWVLGNAHLPLQACIACDSVKWGFWSACSTQSWLPAPPPPSLQACASLGH